MFFYGTVILVGLSFVNILAWAVFSRGKKEWGGWEQERKQMIYLGKDIKMNKTQESSRGGLIPITLNVICECGKIFQVIETEWSSSGQIAIQLEPIRACFHKRKEDGSE